VAFDDQDPARWDVALIGRGEALLERAHRFGRPGRFQYEAAIQSAHCSRAFGTAVDLNTVRKLYRALVSTAPSLGAMVALAALDGEIDGPLAGLRGVDALDADRYQPAWVVRAHLLEAAGRPAESAAALRRAIALTPEPAVAEYLAERLPHANS
jgi:RNA polymerase sigma-70 factor (ECF subfamily)